MEKIADRHILLNYDGNLYAEPNETRNGESWGRIASDFILTGMCANNKYEVGSIEISDHPFRVNKGDNKGQKMGKIPLNIDLKNDMIAAVGH